MVLFNDRSARWQSVAWMKGGNLLPERVSNDSDTAIMIHASQE